MIHLSEVLLPSSQQGGNGSQVQELLSLRLPKDIGISWGRSNMEEGAMVWEEQHPHGRTLQHQNGSWWLRGTTRKMLPDVPQLCPKPSKVTG